MVYETAQRLHQSWHLDSQRRASAAAWVEGYEHAEDFAEPDEKPFSVWDNPYIKPGENPDGSVR